MMFLLELRIPLGTKRGAPVAAFPPDPGFSRIVIGSDMRGAPVLRTGANSLARECPIWVKLRPSAPLGVASGMRRLDARIGMPNQRSRLLDRLGPDEPVAL